MANSKHNLNILDHILINKVSLSYYVHKKMYISISVFICILLFGILALITGLMLKNNNLSTAIFLISIPIGIIVGIRVKKIKARDNII